MAEPAQEVKLFSGAWHQPSIIRAQQKDELYLQLLVESCHDVVRRLLGPRAALLWARETQALGELLYYALTTGRGTQTLGEEYCDILQATGRLGAPPGAAQRGMLVLLQSLGPYLAERLAAPQPDDSFAAWQAERWQQQQQQQQQGQQSEGAAAQARWLLLWVRVRAAAQQLRERAEATAQPLVLRCAGPAAFVRDHWASLLRLQLALFYLYGNYYQLPKRLTGVRYLYLGRMFEGRPSYHVLGLLLCAQLGVSAGLWLLRSSGHWPQWGAAASELPAKPRHAVLLDEDGNEIPPADRGGRSPGLDPSGEVPTSRKCPLCLSAREFPTATPCGHVFCWQCITEWCNQKAECPLCRAAVQPSTLVRVLHADF